MVLPCNSTTSPRGDAGCLVQIVDVLRDHRRRPCRGDTAREREMAAAGLRRREMFLHREAAPPCLVAHLAACEELIERNRLRLGPQAAGRTEIRNAAFGRDPGAGKRHHALGLSIISRSRATAVSRSGAIMLFSRTVRASVAQSRIGVKRWYRPGTKREPQGSRKLSRRSHIARYSRWLKPPWRSPPCFP